MGLAETQALLARLYTDAPLRARFLADPAAVGASCGVTAREAADLAVCAGPQIERFARSLIHKRRREVEKLLPGSLRALGPGRFSALFDRHAAAYVPSGVARHRSEALAFAASIRPGDPEGAFARDMLRYEAARLVASDPARRWVSCRCRHPVADLIGAGASPRPRATLYFWFRPLRRGVLCHLAWPPRSGGAGAQA